MKIIKRSLETANLRSQLDDKTVVDNSKRTVELIWSTGFKGLRRGWDTSFYEELSMKSEDVDMSRLQAGAPLLASHDSYSLGSVIGVVERAWIENGVGKASVRFSTDPDADKIFQKVREKILRNVSVGYDVKKYEKVSGGTEEIPTYRATKWQPMEISIVAMGFDPGAQVRKQERFSEVEIDESTNSTKVEKENMSENTKQAVQVEKDRANEIRAAVRAAKLDESFADELINNDTPADEARKQVLAKLVEKQPEPINNTSRTNRSFNGEDNHTKRMNCFEDAVLQRIDPKNFKVTEDSKALFGRSLLQQAEFFVPRYIMESDSAYAKRSMSSSDLPLALANLAEKALQKSYELAPKSYTRWCGESSVRNYKEASFVQLSDYPSLVERPENAEYEYGAVSEKNEVARIADYGKIVSFSSQMLVNDDLGGLQKLASGGGLAMARLVNRLAYLALTTNKTMKDGVVLYHGDHTNLGTPGAISETTLNEALKSMLKQTNVGGLDKLNLYPKFLICGPDKMTEAKKQLAIIQAATSSTVNPFSASMELVVDAEITGNQYYFACDPNVIDTVNIIKLQGNEQPSIQHRVNFSNDALELKVSYPVAAAPMEWRGLYKNAGN